MCAQICRLAGGIMLAAVTATAVVPNAYAQFNQELHEMLPDHIKQSGKVTAAGAFKAPPTIYANANDASKAEGLAPDLSRAVGEVLGVEFQWKNVPWPGQIPGLRSGNFNVLWGQVGVLPERERELFDIVPFNESRIGVLTRKGSPVQISNLASLCGLKIGVSLGASYVAELAATSEKHCTSAGKPAIVVREYSDVEHPALLSGQVDAAINPYGVSRRLAEKLPGVEAVALPQEETRGLFATILGVAVSKDNPGLSKAIAGALQTLHENGTWKKIAEAHGLAEDMPAPEMVKVNALTGTPAGEVVRQ